MAIREFIEAAEPPGQTVTVLNREQPELLSEMLADFFEPMSVGVAEATMDADQPTDAVLLHEDGAPLAVSPLDDLYNSALGVNVDRYATGDHGLDDLETPDVVTELGPVQVPGDRENKYVLIQVSRHIEAMAYKTGSGELHSSFQRLSRLVGERGTRKVYERLGASGVDTHVYGVHDADLSGLPATVHADDCEELRRAWFVVHDGDGNDGWKAALVARELELGSNAYHGFWTFDPDTVDAVHEYVTETYPPARVDAA